MTVSGLNSTKTDLSELILITALKMVCLMNGFQAGSLVSTVTLNTAQAAQAFILFAKENYQAKQLNAQKLKCMIVEDSSL